MTTRPFHACLSGLLLIVVSGVAFAAAAAAGVSPSGPSSEGTDRYVVWGAPNAGDFSLLTVPLGSAVDIAGGEIVRRFEDANVLVVELTAKERSVLSSFAGVTVEPDVRVRTASNLDRAWVATDNWGLDRLDQVDVALDGRFGPIVGGEGVEIFVIDTGIDALHPEVAGRIGEGLDLIQDGNGLGDCNGHGTLVASLAAGATVGAARAASIRPVRALDCEGSGWASDVAAGIDWARTHANGPAVINLSIGGATSAVLDDAIDRAVADGLVVVVAAGNSGADACNSSPGRSATALTVGATTNSDAIAAFSDIGRCVDLYAPGLAVLGATAGDAERYSFASGTSVSAPLVAGLAALVLSDDPTLSVDAVLEVLLDAATPQPAAMALSPVASGSQATFRLAQLPLFLNGSLSFDPMASTVGWGTAPDAPESVWTVIRFAGTPGAVARVTIDDPTATVARQVPVGQDGFGTVAWVGEPGRRVVLIDGGHATVTVVVDAEPKNLSPGIAVSAVVVLGPGDSIVGLGVEGATQRRVARLTVNTGDETVSVLTDRRGVAWLATTDVERVSVEGSVWVVD